MPGRRVPLSNNPNAINSPFRGVNAVTVTTKSKRPHATVQLEDTYGQPPPAKKQIIESYQSLKTPPRYPIKQTGTLGLQSRKDNDSHQLILERKALKNLETKNSRTVSKADWGLKDDHESIRQWQKHNRRMFPNFVFYFENVASEAQVKYAKAVMSLGAREEKFFSNTVTHVITTRNIPPENQASSIAHPKLYSNAQPQKSQSLISDNSIEKPLESNNTSESVSKPNYTHEASERKLGLNSSTGDSKKQKGRTNDVLHKARELGMKIWSLEKLERIINVMFDTDSGYHSNHGISTRIDPITNTISRLGRERDLQKLLRNERIYGPSDRDLTVASKEIYTFKGPYIYIYDIDEKQKPIMIREYPKVHNKEDGDWPQFRSVSNGKCPFIDEVDYGKREAEREMEQVRIRRQLEKEKASSVEKDLLLNPTLQPKPLVSKRVLEEINDFKCSSTVTTNSKNVIAPLKKPLSSKLGANVSARGNAFISRAGVGRLHEGEPAASGVQPAITSAIHSAMSSTAAQPGLKVGTSKEVHDMQRKVLEKKILALNTPNLQYSNQTIDKIALVEDDSSIRDSMIKIPEKLNIIEEASENLQARETLQKTESARKIKSIQQSTTTVRQESKPGYCENCQDKFEDFNEHVISRKHRRFAEKLDNWKALDELLTQLARPLRDRSHDTKSHIKEM